MATSNNEWLEIYLSNLTGPSQQTNMQWSDDVVTHATTVTTVPPLQQASSASNNQLGRVARPNNMRRRSRASSRTPITLLNTDITNFRAMVQQFTGGTAFMTAHATTTAPRRPLGGYNINSSGSNYYGTGSRISPPTRSYNIELVAGDHQHGFV